MQLTPSRFQPQSRQEIVSLTDKQRDEIDFEAKTIIRQTMNRIKTMESLEKGILLKPNFPRRIYPVQRMSRDVRMGADCRTTK